MSALMMLDLSAAFDTIDHQTLLQRLGQLYGLGEKALAWVSSYLTDRYQTVTVNGECSDPVRLKFGVPQGSVLGPKMYIMYTKPLGSIMRHHGLGHHFYADDSQAYVAFKPTDDDAKEDAVSLIDKCFQETELWMTENMLKLNGDKTEVMIFTSKHNVRHAKDIKIKVGDATVTSASAVRNLGVIYDPCLTMDQHINSVCRSGYGQLRNIGHIRRCLTSDSSKSLVSGLVSSRLDYCNALLYGLPNTSLSKLQRVQNTAARIISRTSRHSHITPTLKELHWLPIQSRIEYKIMMNTFKALHAQAPAYIGEAIHVYEPKRPLRSQSELSLTVPRMRTVTYGERCFSKAAPSLWNALPSHIRDVKTLATFKRSLKTHLFKEYYKC